MIENWQVIIKSILFFGLLIILLASIYFLKPGSKEGFQTKTQYDLINDTVMTTDMIKIPNITGIVTLKIHAYDHAYFNPSEIARGDPVTVTAVDLTFDTNSVTDPSFGATSTKMLSTRRNIQSITNKNWTFNARIVSYKETLQEDESNGSRYVATMVIDTIEYASDEFKANMGTDSYYSVTYNSYYKKDANYDGNVVYPECVGITSKDDEKILGDEKGDETIYLDNYEIYNLEAPVPKDTTPLNQYDKSNMLAEFDVNAPIPWDYDLYDQDPKEILWGTVHSMTSKDIFNKCYTRFVLGSANNVEYNEVQKAYVYHSPIFGGSWTDPTQINEIQLAEFYVQYKAGDIVQKITGDNLEKLWKPWFEKTNMHKVKVMRDLARETRTEYLKKNLQGYKYQDVQVRDWYGNLKPKYMKDADGNILKDLDGNPKKAQKLIKDPNFVKPKPSEINKIYEAADDAAETKVRAFLKTEHIVRDEGKVLTSSESAVNKLRKIFNFDMELESLKPLKNFAKGIIGRVRSVFNRAGLAGRTSKAAESIAKTGGKIVEEVLVSRPITATEEKLVKKALTKGLMAKLAPKITTKLAVGMTELGVGDSLAMNLANTFVIPPLFQFEIPITVDTLLGVLSLALVVLVPAIFSAFIPADAICPKDYPFNLADAVENAPGGGIGWVIITSIPLIGDALAAFAPYICSSPSGACALKVGPKIPAYFYDSSLSLFFNTRKRGYADGDAALSNPIEYYEHKMIDNPDKPEKVYTSPEIDDPVIWIDFSEPAILDKMAKYYYDMSRKLSQTNSDGSVTFEYITKFYGIIGSSQYSCDVQCELEEITYWPFSGKVKCKRKVPNPDPKISNTRYHDRRFYFYVDITAGLNMSERQQQKTSKYLIYQDNLTKYKLSGCTHVDGTGIDALEISTEGGYVGDAMVSLGDPGSMYNAPKLFVHGSVIDSLLAQARGFKDSVDPKKYPIGDHKGQGLSGNDAANWAQQQILLKGEQNILVTEANIPPDNTCSVVRSNLLKFGKVVSNPDLGSNVQTHDTPVFYTRFERNPTPSQWTPISNNSTKIFDVVYIPESNAQRNGTFWQTAITSCIGMAWPTWGGVGTALAGMAGISDAIACGYQDVLSQSGTYIVNGIIVSTDDRYIINRGPTVDYAPGYTPANMKDTVANRCSSVSLELADCTSRYSVRRAVTYYHSIYKNRRIKRIYDISIRRQRSDTFKGGSDQSMCVYNLDYADYDPSTYKESTSTTNQSIGMIYSQDPNDETCTFKPDPPPPAPPPNTVFTDIVPPLQVIPQPPNIYDNVLTVLPAKDTTLSLRAKRPNCKATAGLYDTCDDVFIQKNIADIFNYSYNNFPEITKINASSMTYDPEKNDYPVCHYDVNYQNDLGNQVVSDHKIISFNLTPGTTRRLPSNFVDGNFNTKNTSTSGPYTMPVVPTNNSLLTLNVQDTSKFAVGNSVYVMKKPDTNAPQNAVAAFSATVNSLAGNLLELRVGTVYTGADDFKNPITYAVYVIPNQEDLNNCLWDYTSENVKKKTLFNKVPKDGHWIDIPSLPPPVNNSFIRDTCSLKNTNNIGKYSQATLDTYSDCSGIAQISRLVNAFNIKHSSYTKSGLTTTPPSRKIIKVLRASTPAVIENDPKNPGKYPICDYEVEMLRDITGELQASNTSIINQKETVRFYLKPFDKDTGVTKGLVGTLVESINEYISPSEYKDCLYDYADDGSDTINSGYSISRDSDETLFTTPYLWPIYFMDQAKNIVNKAIKYYQGYDIEGTLKTTSIQSLNITSKILSDVLANSYLGVSPVCDGKIHDVNGTSIATTKQQCRDQMTLRSIVNRYNYMNYPPYPSGQFGVEKRKIIEIRRAGVSEPYKCQILLIEKIEFYKDFTKKPVHAVNITDSDVKYNERYFERRFQFPVTNPKGDESEASKCVFYLNTGTATETEKDKALTGEDKDKFTYYTIANNLMDISSNAFAIQSDLSVITGTFTIQSSPTVIVNTNNSTGLRFFNTDSNGVETDAYFQGIDISPGSPNKTNVLTAIKTFYNGLNVNTNPDRGRYPKYHKLKEVKAYFHPTPDIIELYVTVDHAVYNPLFKTWATKASDNTILVAKWNKGGKYNIDTNIWTDSPPDSVTEYFSAWIDWTLIDAEKGVWKATDKFTKNPITDEIPYIYYTDFSQYPKLPEPKDSNDTATRIRLYDPSEKL
jgi:hypothetical protein